MNPIWVILSIVCALLALVFEFWTALREKKIRQILEQTLDTVSRTRNRLWRSAFFTAILCLLFGIFLAGSHKQWIQPIQGVAVVIDTSVQTHGTSDRLALEKAAAVELLRSLPGETFSLWELRGDAVQEIVPPTVDRLFLEVLLDGLIPSPPSSIRPSLSSVRDAVVKNLSGVPPWVVCITRSDLPSDQKRIDGAASITVSVQSLVCRIVEDGFSRNETSIEEVGAVIARRLSRSYTTTPPDRTESWLLSAAAFISLVCCVLWRRAVPPIATLGFLLCSTLEAISPASANNEAKQAIDIANNSDFTASEEYIDGLLTSTNDPEARGRLLYDKALLAYLQGRDNEAIQWLTMEPSTLAYEPTAAQTLRGMALIRLVLASTAPREETLRKEALTSWLHTRPPVDPNLIASASLALITPSSRNPDIDSVRRSLLWLEECIQDGAATDAESAADLLTQKMNRSIERRLGALWPKSVVNNFSSSTQILGPNKVSALRIWYDLASTTTVDQGVSFVINQASMSAQEALYFPSSSARSDLTMTASLLSQLLPNLPEDQQLYLKKVSPKNGGDASRNAAEWYARAAVWPAVAEGKDLLKPLALVLFHEADTEDNPLIRQSLASFSRALLSLPTTSGPSIDSLDSVLRQVLAEWYEQDPVDALDGALREAFLFPDQWKARLTELLTPSIHKAMNSTDPLLRAVAEAIGGALPQTDVELSVRVWQIAISPCKTPQDTERYIDHLTLLFSELAPKLATPSDSVYRSLVLVYSVQPFILEQVQSSRVFQKNPTKRALYDQLLSEWEESCSGVQQRLAEPLSFRLPRVQQDVKTSLGVLHRLQALLHEGEAIQPMQPQERIHEGTSGTQSVRGDDAVRLFQEMDRSDRSL